MTPGEIRACYRLYAAHRKSHEICAFPGIIPATSNAGDSDDFAVLLRLHTGLESWRVTLATASQTTTYAPPSSGLSVICERCSHRSLSNLFGRGALVER
jgi:hypothetical protein